jgi:hypothetical protein
MMKASRIVTTKEEGVVHLPVAITAKHLFGT